MNKYIVSVLLILLMLPCMGYAQAPSSWSMDRVVRAIFRAAGDSNTTSITFPRNMAGAFRAAYYADTDSTGALRMFFLGDSIVSVSRKLTFQDSVQDTTQFVGLVIADTIAGHSDTVWVSDLLVMSSGKIVADTIDANYLVGVTVISAGTTYTYFAVDTLSITDTLTVTGKSHFIGETRLDSAIVKYYIKSDTIYTLAAEGEYAVSVLRLIASEEASVRGQGNTFFVSPKIIQITDAEMVISNLDSIIGLTGESTLYTKAYYALPYGGSVAFEDMNYKYGGSGGADTSYSSIRVVKHSSGQGEYIISGYGGNGGIHDIGNVSTNWTAKFTEDTTIVQRLNFTDNYLFEYDKNNIDNMFLIDMVSGDTLIHWVQNDSMHIRVPLLIDSLYKNGTIHPGDSLALLIDMPAVSDTLDQIFNITMIGSDSTYIDTIKTDNLTISGTNARLTLQGESAHDTTSIDFVASNGGSGWILKAIDSSFFQILDKASGDTLIQFENDDAIMFLDNRTNTTDTTMYIYQGVGAGAGVSFGGFGPAGELSITDADGYAGMSINSGLGQDGGIVWYINEVVGGANRYLYDLYTEGDDTTFVLRSYKNSSTDANFLFIVDEDTISFPAKTKIDSLFSTIYVNFSGNFSADSIKVDTVYDQNTGGIILKRAGAGQFEVKLKTGGSSTADTRLYLYDSEDVTYYMFQNDASENAFDINYNGTPIIRSYGSDSLRFYEGGSSTYTDSITIFPAYPNTSFGQPSVDSLVTIKVKTETETAKGNAILYPHYEITSYEATADSGIMYTYIQLPRNLESVTSIAAYMLTDGTPANGGVTMYFSEDNTPSTIVDSTDAIGGSSGWVRRDEAAGTLDNFSAGETLVIKSHMWAKTGTTVGLGKLIIYVTKKRMP